MSLTYILRLSACWGLVILLNCLTSAAWAQAAWEYSPYMVRVWMSVPVSPQLSAPMLNEIVARVESRAEAVVGAPWSATIEPMPLAIRDRLWGTLEITAEQLKADAPEALTADKVMLVAIEPGSLGWDIAAREFDCRTRQTGPLIRRPAGCTHEIPFAVWDALREAFVPIAKIESVDGTTVVARLRAGGLVTKSGSPVLVHQDQALQPVVRRNDRGGEPAAKTGIQALAWTLLAVESRDESLLMCKLHSGYRGSLTARATPRTERFALLIKPQFDATTLALRSRTGDGRPLSGYEIYTKRPDAEDVVHLGTSDWRGQIDLPRGQAELTLILIRNGTQLLARLPIVPGQEQRLVADLMDDDGRLQAEGAVAALYSRALDLVARREILASRFRARLKENKLDEAQKLLEEFRRLESRSDLGRALDEMMRSTEANDRLTQQRINKLFVDARKLLTVKGLADDTINVLASELVKAQTTQKTTGTAPAFGAKVN
jgi:hypothetical protein